ncbi:SLC13 family permease [Modestobacter roseus]|uniref:Arsenite efflux membrane protein ArsB (TC 3.A.4.1.1 TC 2.A.45.1.1) n=1 Tax=Modestobacter roseus TaxID=1181884 RepID=A0A562IMY0_9ACTN|nr:SLC13 family permease [Modestobacter roseus]MQA32491.1 arsenic transporter [Modestobacter roseus]TWH72242.1 arsenite efflux membrane protein ArsB (TC 3.A.4.1.1; TC 2.A.45.1.1) [Modestobacter roseus]
MAAWAVVPAGVFLTGTLVAAAADHRRVPPAAVAVPGALLVVAGALPVPAAVDRLREVAPTAGFLVVVLLLAALADREGLFRWAAAVTARRAGRSAGGLLWRVTLLATAVTAVLSLDATVVLLTPVVVATAARMRVPVAPHGMVVGHLANSASLLLPVSNLTNLLAVAATGLSFVHFTGLMALPQLAAVAVEYGLLRWLFRRDLRAVAGAPSPDGPAVPRLALAVVGLTVAGFVAASLADLPPVLPAVAGVLVLAVRQLATRRTRPAELLVAANLPFALFVLGLAVIVAALQRAGLGSLLTALLPGGASLSALLAAAGLAALLANLVNNLPATLALVPVAAAAGTPTVLAVLIGLNVGPNLTYAGSLANLLWRRVLGEHAPAAARFSSVGLVTVPLTLAAATAALWLALQI